MQPNGAQLGKAMYDDYVELATRRDERAVVFVAACHVTPKFR